MPIYEYRCSKCNHTMEALQKMSDAPLRKCPACSKAGLQKLVSAASFRLKGGGWYETDFKTGDKKQLVDKDSSNDSSGDSGRANDGNSAKADKADKADKPVEANKSEAAKSETKSSSATGKSDKTGKASAKKRSSRST